MEKQRWVSFVTITLGWEPLCNHQGNRWTSFVTIILGWASFCLTAQLKCVSVIKWITVDIRHYGFSPLCQLGSYERGYVFKQNGHLRITADVCNSIYLIYFTYIYIQFFCIYIYTFTWTLSISIHNNDTCINIACNYIYICVCIIFIYKHIAYCLYLQAKHSCCLTDNFVTPVLGAKYNWYPQVRQLCISNRQ